MAAIIHIKPKSAHNRSAEQPLCAQTCWLVGQRAKFKTTIFLGDKLILSELTGKTEISELSEIYH